MPSKAKFDLVAEVKEHLDRAQSIVVADYRGLSVAQMTDLRVKLRAKGAELKVVKNRLARIAFKEHNLPAADEYLQGPSAFAFSYEDPTAAAKVLSEFAKTNEKLVLKCALFEGTVMDAKGVDVLSKMPGRPELLGRLVADLKWPPTKLALALKATVNKVAYALQAVARKREEAA